MPRDPAWRLYRLLGEAIRDHAMIRSGDSVLLGISGGKDSLLMAYMLADLRRRSPVKFALGAVTVNPGDPSGFTEDELGTIGCFMESLDIPYHVVPTGIARIVQEHPLANSACSLCANLRRGSLYKAANDLGYRKVALAHHLDDAVETFFLNMFYQSSLRCFEPKSYLTRRNVEVIRPLIYIPEKDVVKNTQRLGLPVVKTRCPVAGTTHRQSMKELVTTLSQDIPNFRNHVRGALKGLWKPQDPGKSGVTCE